MTTPLRKVFDGAKKIRGLLFDVDGTLFSSETIIADIYTELIDGHRAVYGRPLHTPDRSAIMAQVGKPVKTIFHNLIPDVPQEEQDQISEKILARLVTSIRQGGGIYYPQMSETLHELKRRGYKLYAASNGRKPYVEIILKTAEVIHLFDDVPVVDNVNIFNKNELVSFILREHKLQNDEAAMIGDRASDRDAAEFCNTPFIACTYGHGKSEEHKGAVVLVDRLSDLLQIFTGIP